MNLPLRSQPSSRVGILLSTYRYSRLSSKPYDDQFAALISSQRYLADVERLTSHHDLYLGRLHRDIHSMRSYLDRYAH